MILKIIYYLLSLTTEKYYYIKEWNYLNNTVKLHHTVIPIILFVSYYSFSIKVVEKLKYYSFSTIRFGAIQVLELKYYANSIKGITVYLLGLY